MSRSAKFVSCGAAGVVLLVALRSVGASEPVQESSMSEGAPRMIEACVAYAAERKLPPLSVAVVDETGSLVNFTRQSGGAGLTVDAAILKARTALQARAPTSDLTADMSDATARDIYLLLHVTTMPGGVPLMRQDGSLRGAVGVSGAQPDQDAACAAAAVGSAVATAGTHGEQEGPVGAAIRARLKEFEDAWNAGDVARVSEQYHPSMFAIYQSAYLNYTQYIKLVKEGMNPRVRARLRLDVESVRALGGEYALANGREHDVGKDGKDQTNLFTVIYKRSEGTWKFVYAHT